MCGCLYVCVSVCLSVSASVSVSVSVSVWTHMNTHTTTHTGASKQLAIQSALNCTHLKDYTYCHEAIEFAYTDGMTENHSKGSSPSNLSINTHLRPIFRRHLHALSLSLSLLVFLSLHLSSPSVPLPISLSPPLCETGVHEIQADFVSLL